MIAIRVGIEGGRKPVLARARTLGAPILISANSLWDDKRGRFGRYGQYIGGGYDLALDSGGFVAMQKYFNRSNRRSGGPRRQIIPTGTTRKQPITLSIQCFEARHVECSGQDTLISGAPCQCRCHRRPIA